MSTAMSLYDAQAQAWATKWGVSMSLSFTGHRKYFTGDADTRDTYSVTLKRGSRSMVFDFGASLMGSKLRPESDGPHWRKVRSNPGPTGSHNPAKHPHGVAKPRASTTFSRASRRTTPRRSRIGVHRLGPTRTAGRRWTRSWPSRKRRRISGACAGTIPRCCGRRRRFSSHPLTPTPTGARGFPRKGRRKWAGRS